MSETTLTETNAESASEDTVLEVRDATATFNMDRGTARVLNGVDIDVQRGETLGIVGESGSGKSVFASALLDSVVDPGQLSGEIMYHPSNGDPINVCDLGKGDLRRIRWEEIAMVFQGAMSSFNPTKTIETHFTETIKAHNEDKEEGLDRARDLMRELNLEPDRMLDSYQHELSGGQRQRLLIALALVLEPEVLILDEPTAALDLRMQRLILGLLHDLKEEYDLTLVFITHDLPIVAGFADRLAVMYGFEFVELGATDDVLRNGAHPYTRALVMATPSIDTGIEDLHTISGESPDPINIPSGCSYHPRCPIATDRCETDDPELLALDNGQQAACFYTDQARSKIHVSLAEDDTQ